MSFGFSKFEYIIIAFKSRQGENKDECAQNAVPYLNHIN